MSVKRKVKLKSGLKLGILFFLVFLGIISFGRIFHHDSRLEKVDEKAEKRKVPQESSLKLFMVGDALIHSAIYEDARQNDGSYDFKPMIEFIKPISSKYDLVYYNQETILGGEELGLSNYPMFNSPYEVGDAFLDAGFNLVSLATNHTMDKGEDGVLNSVKYWKKHKDVVTSGQWSSAKDREESVGKIYQKNGIKYAFLSYTTWTNGLETPSGKEYLNNVYSKEKAGEDIARVRDKADVVIVAMHWGTEYSLGVSSDQAQIADDLSEMGVDLIIGAHPHVVEPVEYINDGKTFVIYSLGNFISDQEGVERLTGLMMEVTIKKKLNEDHSVSISIENPKAELSYTKSYYRGGRNFKVYPYSKLDNNILPGYSSYYNKYSEVVSERYPDLSWGLTEE